MPSLQPEQLKILRLLARTQFASLDLLHKLTGSQRKPRSTYHLLHEIEHGLGLICHKVFYTRNKQALGTTYALTKAGAAYVAELEAWPPGAVYYPQGGISFAFADHFHREACAWFAAKFWEWADSTEDIAVSHCVGYWRKDGSQFAVNRVVVPGLDYPIIPDWVLRFEHGCKSRLVAVEIDRTTGRTRLLDRVRHYAQAIDTQAISQRFGHPRAPFVLLVTESPQRMAQLLEDIHAGKAGASFVKDFLGNFQVSTLPDIAARGVAAGFFRLDGTPSPLFAAPT